MIYTPHGGHVIVAGPFPSQAAKKAPVKGGMVQIETYYTLVPLVVVYGNDKFDPGDVLYFRSTTAAESWTKLGYRLPDSEQDLMIAPIEQIVIAEKKGYTR